MNQCRSCGGFCGGGYGNKFCQSIGDAYEPKPTTDERLTRLSEWISVEDRLPDKKEPVVYLKPTPSKKAAWSVGIAHWTVNERWNPEHVSMQAPNGFTHWTPLPSPPEGAE